LSVKSRRLIRKGAPGPSAASRAGAAGGALLYGGGLGGAGGAFGGVVGGLAAGPAGAFAGAAVGQTIDQLGRGLASLADQAAGLQRMRRGLAMAAKDAEDFAASEEQVRKSSEKLLLPLEQTYKYFSQLRVNTKQYNLSVEETGRIMEGVALAVSSTGGSLEDVDGAMRAVVQIFSKGSVQAEELRGQLGERFPGAVVKFAQANNMSFEQLQDALKKGEVGIKEFVKFAEENYEDYARFSEQLATAPEYAGRRLGLAFEEMQRSVGAALGPAGAIIQDFLADSINGINDFLQENKAFLTEYVTIWAKAFVRVGEVLGGFLKLLAKVGIEIAKFFKNLTFGIRNMFNLVGVAEVKAQIEKLDAQILATSDRRSQRRLKERRATLQSQFSGMGGEAALAALEGEDNFTFGGAGAGLDLSALTGGGGGGAGRSRKAKELRDYTTNLEQIYRDQFEIRKFAIEQDSSLSKRAKDIQIAQALFEAERASAVFRYHQKLSEAEEYRIDKRAQYIKDLEDSLQREEEIAERRYSETVLAPLRQAIEAERESIAKTRLEIEALSKGREKLSAIEKAEAFIKMQLDGLNKQAIDGYQKEANILRELARQQDAVNSEKEAAIKLREQEKKFTEAMQTGRNRLSMAFAITPGQEIRERLRQEGYAPSQIEDLAKLEEAAMVMEDLKANVLSVKDAFSSTFSEMITGSASAQESLAQSFANIGKSFADMAARLVTEWLFMKAIGLTGSLFLGSSTLTSSGGAAMTAGQATDAGFNMGASLAKGFATGGVVTGPTLGLIGEGRFNEAVVPLPNGKSIPVDLGGGAGGDIATSIVVNVNNGQASSSMKGNQGNQLAKNIEGAVKEVIMRETRPGGIIYSSRQ